MKSGIIINLVAFLVHIWSLKAFCIQEKNKTILLLKSKKQSYLPFPLYFSFFTYVFYLIFINFILSFVFVVFSSFSLFFFFFHFQIQHFWCWFVSLLKSYTSVLVSVFLFAEGQSSLFLCVKSIGCSSFLLLKCSMLGLLILYEFNTTTCQMMMIYL